MISLISIVLSLGLASPLHAAACNYSSQHIDVDVAIIGGGSAGIYAATRLTDYNKSVVILESKDQIGGHAESYYDSLTGAPVNLGVVIFTNTTTITNYLTRYNVPLTRFDLASLTSGASYAVNYDTGSIITNITASSAEAQALALQTWAAQLAKYPGITFGYNLPSPVPEDLLLPFGEFITKYKLEALVQTIYQFNQGFVPLLEIPALYVLKYFGPYQLQSLQQGYFLVSATGDTRTLYKNAAASLGSKILYGVSGLKVTRSSKGPISIKVGNSSSGKKIIRAKKLIFAVPPTLERLQSAGFDLTASEAQLFGKLYANAYYSLLLNNTGISATVTNYDTSKPFNVPTFPNVYSTGPTATIPGLVDTFFASPRELDINTVAAQVIASIQRLPASVRGNSTATPQLVTAVKHSPFNPMVCTEEIRAGYYSTLEAQQGVKNTWYIGGAWATASSSTIWEGLEQVFLPQFLSAF